jgi:hypothetical protein
MTFISLPTPDTYVSNYKGMELTLHNFPAMKCQCVGCQEIVYGSGSLIKNVRFAKSQYDQYGIRSIDVNEIVRFDINEGMQIG